MISFNCLKSHYRRQWWSKDKIRIKRHLDGVLFAYPLDEGEVRELPGVLATMLRQTFAEVMKTARRG